VLSVAEVVAKHSAGMVASTFIAYVLLYVGLLIAYVAVVKRLAEKPTRGQALNLPVAGPPLPKRARKSVLPL
jgi:cytochrome bd ubiquinol oxidase subunit I